MEPQQTSRKSTSSAFAIASLILGIVAIATSVTIFLGGVAAVLAIVFGLLHLQEVKDRGRGMAWAGLSIGIVGFILTGVMVLVFAHLTRHGLTGGSVAKWKNKPAPELVLTTVDGDEVDLGALRGRPVLIDMWATWCGPCRSEIPELVKMRRDYSPDQLAIIGISDESAATVRKFATENGVNYAMVADADLPAPFNDVNALPTKFMIDSNGIIRRVLVGASGAQTLHDLVTSVQ